MISAFFESFGGLAIGFLGASLACGLCCAGSAKGCGPKKYRISSSPATMTGGTERMRISSAKRSFVSILLNFGCKDTIFL